MIINQLYIKKETKNIFNKQLLLKTSKKINPLILELDKIIYYFCIILFINK